MSKRTRPKPVPKEAPAPSGEPASLGAEVLRRMLLAVATALIAARPFVRSEDPGLLSDFSDPGSMVLTFLAMMGCAGWAAWRLWSPRGGVYLGAVEVGLFLLAVLFFVGASVAPYARAAYLTAAEWLGLALLLFLVRQLATRPGDQQGLMAALLATTVALSAQGVYQVAREIPRAAAAGETIQQSVSDYSRIRLATPTRLEEAQIRDQLENRRASGVFFHPSSLAACLVLLLPLTGGALVASLRAKLPRPVTVGVLVSLVLGCVTLALTRDAVAACVLALVGLPALGLVLPARFGGAKAGALLGLLAASGVVAYFHFSGRLAADVALWREAWPATWKMVEEHFWRGIGPAQFRFTYPRFMAESASYKLTSPASSVLEVLAEVGVGGALLLGLMLAALLVAVWRWWHGTAAGDQRPAAGDVQAAPDESSAGDVRWEFYLGGMFAAITAFTLQAGSNSTVDVLNEAIVAAFRSVVWFFAFALFERLSWTPREFVGSLLVGVLAAAALFCVEPGLGYPGVAALLWVAVALILAVVRPAPVAWPGRSESIRSVVAVLFAPRATAALLLPAFVAGSFGYFALVLFPASKSSASIVEAHLGADQFLKDAKEKPEDRKFKDPLRAIDQMILIPLQLANREDGDNPKTLRMLSGWSFHRWATAPGDASNQGTVTRDRSGNEKLTPSMDERARQWAEKARKANPQDPTNYRAEYEIHEGRCKLLTRQALRLEERNKTDKKLTAAQRNAFANEIATLRDEARLRYRAAAGVIALAIPHDPSNPTLHFLLAAARYEGGDRVGAKEAAEEALRLDRVVGSPRSLTDRQRSEMGPWLLPQSPR